MVRGPEVWIVNGGPEVEIVNGEGSRGRGIQW